MRNIFSLVLLTTALFSSCENNGTEDLLPNSPVYLYFSLGDARYTDLNSLGGYYAFTTKPTLTSYIGNGGILVVHSLSPLDTSYPFAAYDLYCTYEKNVCVIPQKGGLYAICPKCGSKYDISSGFGNCVSGPAKQLRVYKTYYSASRNDIIVTK